MILMACGGGNGGGLGSDAITAAEAEPFCAADCQRDFDCGDGTDVATCTSSCVAETAGWARGDAVETIFDCFAGLACGENDDQCALLVEPLAIHNEWETGCRAQLTACFTEPADAEVFCEVSPGGDEIGFFRFVAPEIISEMITCLDGADCTARQTCLSGVFEAHNLPLN